MRHPSDLNLSGPGPLGEQEDIVISSWRELARVRLARINCNRSAENLRPLEESPACRGEQVAAKEHVVGPPTGAGSPAHPAQRRPVGKAVRCEGHLNPSSSALEFALQQVLLTALDALPATDTWETAIQLLNGLTNAHSHIVGETSSKITLSDQVAIITFVVYGINIGSPRLTSQLEGIYYYWQIILGLYGTPSYTAELELLGPKEDELVSLVQNSFPPVSFPAQPLQPGIRIDAMNEDELAPVLQHQAVDTVSADHLRGFSWVFRSYYFTADGWKYYLPAVLLGLIRGIEVDLADRQPTGWEEYAPLLTTAQRAAVWLVLCLRKKCDLPLP